MLEILIESKRKRDRKKYFGVGLVSLVVHTAVIAGAVIATVSAGQSDNKVRVDTALVYLEQQQQKPPEQQPVQLDVPLKGFQTVVAPTEIPTNIPPVNLQEKFDPKDYSGSGVEGGTANGITPGDVYMESLVEEKPVVLSGRLPQYPPLLQQAGIQGTVMVQAIVDTTGRVEPSSVRVVQSPNPGFDEPSKSYILRALFRPARVHGRPVRVLVALPVQWRLNPR